jgi:hypothetical protein
MTAPCGWSPRPAGDPEASAAVGGVAGRGHGLADRLRGMDGTLTVSSPVGEPTSLTETLPGSSMTRLAFTRL